jgi:hypothetical protein
MSCKFRFAQWKLVKTKTKSLIKKLSCSTIVMWCLEVYGTDMDELCEFISIGVVTIEKLLWGTMFSGLVPNLVTLLKVAYDVQW